MVEAEFPKIPERGANTLAFAFAFIMSFGGIANAIVVITHLKFRHVLLKEAKDVLIFSLAVGDLIMTSLVCPLGFSSALAQRWTSGDVGCTWYGFVTTWIGLASILQLAVISVERCHTLSRPNAAPTSRKWALRAIAASWVAALAASCLPFFGFSEYTYEGFGLHCSISWDTTKRKYAWYCLLLLVFFYAVPITAITAAYVKMFVVVRRVFRNASAMWGAEAQATKESYMAQVRMTQQLLVVTGGFLFAWSPYAIMSTLKAFTNLEFAVGYHELPALFSKTSNVYNPIIYFFMYKRLRKHAYLIINHIWKKLHC